MAHGFRARNGNNIVTIDQGFSNHELHSKGTVTINSGPNKFGWYTGTFNVPGPSRALLALSCQRYVEFYLIGQVPYSGGTQYQIYCNTPASFEWFSFATPTSDPGGIGLRIKEANGTVNFNSNRKYLRLLDVVSGVRYESGPDISVGFTRNYGGKKIAVVQGILPLEYRFDIFSEFEGYEVTEVASMQVYRLNGQTGVFQYGWNQLGIEGPFDPNSSNQNQVSQNHFSAMVIDVTDM